MNDNWVKVIGLLKQQGITLCTVESCTGGLLSAAITAVPGASEVFAGGIISYSNEVKSKLLGIDMREIEKHTAVSEQVAILMAENGRKLMNADCAVSVTGYAGPWAPEPALVGKVFVALAERGKTQLFNLPELKEIKDRRKIQRAAVDFCKDMLVMHYSLS